MLVAGFGVPPVTKRPLCHGHRRQNVDKTSVGRLSDGTTNDELHSLSKSFGTVTEAVAMGNYGFVVSNTPFH